MLCCTIFIIIPLRKFPHTIKIYVCRVFTTILTENYENERSTNSKDKVISTRLMHYDDYNRPQSILFKNRIITYDDFMEKWE